MLILNINLEYITLLLKHDIWREFTLIYDSQKAILISFEFRKA